MLGVAAVAGFLSYRSRKAARVSLDGTAELLGLKLNRADPRELYGHVRDVEISIHNEELRGSELTGVRFHLRARLPALNIKRSQVSNVAEHDLLWRPVTRPPDSTPSVETGDVELDQIVLIDGDEIDALACLPARVRADLIEVVLHDNFQLENGTPHAWVRGREPEEIAKRIKLVCEVVRDLRELGEKNRRELLELNASADKLMSVRERNLQALLETFPDSEEAARARARALESREPSLMLIAALDTDPPNVAVLEEIAELKRAPLETREQAVLELAQERPVKSLPIFERLFDRPEPLIAAVGLSAMNILDFGMLPVERMLERLEKNEAELTPLILQVLARVDDEGDVLDAELRARVLETLHLRGFHGGGERGSLSIAAADDRGKLSLPVETGTLGYTDEER